ncbi:hypothetical protein DUF1292 [Thermacetogenium phaeum DSM 12270]|uniref:UPF0473 protein Tph_c16900 n=2 Tax=Thermacetogenium phaeum TaxID=85874 RepID=K4LGB9_THEPS|nr:DUF1292 domain-containing protein [Thermacetogenium phaeum]AFV11893.1 hypothetical protein DUF1292 [Thermacetogenium phaeum DSM 12270]KUK36790.1 MAG: hypothetical protein XD66_0502 [Thermacetogenium phaeum]MDK2881072.1 hypothetical protein [Clostridia bacterium]MDN5366462.1 hypothetical protein [Thermacetogenium sp.]
MDFDEREFGEEDIFVLTDDDGQEHEFIFLEKITLDGGEYAVLQPVGEDEAIILKYDRDENGEEILCDIEDDEEWERVADAYEEMIGKDA